MNEEIQFRPIRPRDSSDLVSLIASSPAGGLISFTYDYQADVYETSSGFATEFYGIAATLGSKMVGMVFGDRVKIQLGSAIRDAVYVSNLRVHPSYRRRGIARGMSEFGIDYAQKIQGSDLVLYAAVPEDNISVALIKSYRFQRSKPIQGGIIPMRRAPPTRRPGLRIREPAVNELDEIADGMNAFYADHNLWCPVSKPYLRNFLNQDIAGIRPNQLFVVTRGENILAGLSLSDRTRLVRMKLIRTPMLIRLLGAFLGILPSSGLLETLTVRRVWFREGELEAARYLWQHLRFHLSPQGNSLGIAYDPRDSLAEVFQIPVWLPMVKARYAIRVNEPVDFDRLTYCVAGP